MVEGEPREGNKIAGSMGLGISGVLANVSRAWRLSSHLMKHGEERGAFAILKATSQ